jgi:hypothetical protein
MAKGARRIESPTHSYLFSAGDGVDTATHEAHYRWLIGALGVDPGVKLQYHKYRDRAHLQRVTGRATNGFAEPGTPRFHTIWPWDNHEGVHALVILTLGHPPALFNEAAAVAHQTNPRAGDTLARWNGEPAAQTRAGFLAAYGVTLDAEWERWREFLDAQ